MRRLTGWRGRLFTTMGSCLRARTRTANRCTTSGKGMLLNLAAGQAAAAVGRLEQMGRSGQGSGFQDAFAAFERDIPTLLPQLDACMAEVH